MRNALGLVPSEPWCSRGLLIGKVRTFGVLPGSVILEGGAEKGYLSLGDRGRRFESGQLFGAVAQGLERERTFFAFSPSA